MTIQKEQEDYADKQETAKGESNDSPQIPDRRMGGHQTSPASFQEHGREKNKNKNQRGRG